MSHTCKAALVRCMDFRLGSAIRDFLQKENLYDDVDIISLAGAAKGINDPEDHALEHQIELSKKLHNINTLILMNHTDCGGYGGRAAFENAEVEREHHLKELHNAKEKLAPIYPDVEIQLLLADLKDDGSINIESVE